ncbi:hypothetical protein GQ55_9G417500 [Panicum hallii var. hallii]|uniref:Uncharacterized protein n=1 Tax=Panicum hallii var. hallii TaxID=1504633 RepID=A0A2T7CAL3_9POAL|nr:hypothetical protein GQ55_9G417500 [Panicum hallii var. hallii]
MTPNFHLQADLALIWHGAELGANLSAELRGRPASGAPRAFIGCSGWTASPAPNMHPIMSSSVGAEQFGWVPMPPSLARSIGNLAELDGSLCGVVDLRVDAERDALFTWSGGASWSMRCSINLQNPPRAISDEFIEERVVIPLCSTRQKVLLMMGRHKVFAYDPERVAMERVFSMQEFVDIPQGHREAASQHQAP